MRAASFRVSSVAAFAGVLITIVAAPSAGAATINVAAGSVGASADGKCSLIEAIRNANANSTAGSADCAAGSGPDTIALADGSAYEITAFENTFFGFTGLPVITSQITLDGNGSTVARGGGSPALRLIAVQAGARLTIRDTVLANGLAQGGDGGSDAVTDDGGGGGGGAGLGGAIYNRGALFLTRTTFANNVAQGGSGGDGAANTGGNDKGGGAGGGGLGGDGGTTVFAVAEDAGNGGGGWGGNGAVAGLGAGGGGGGTTNDGSPGGGTLHGPGGLENGGDGGDENLPGKPGGLGGGGGGGGDNSSGGDGGLGGGGGGGGEFDLSTGVPSGGAGGFGGGGGGGGEDSSGGDGGFGGGGGGSHNSGVAITTGSGGFGGGNAGSTGTESAGGGGGAGMGGAVFNDGGAVTVLNSTFARNTAAGGGGGDGTPGTGQDGQAGQGLGGAIFSRNGSLTVTEGTFSDNAGEGGAIFAGQFAGQPASLNLLNSIAANTAGGANDCVALGGVASSGTTNLVELNSGCAGVSAAGDPALGPLQNNGGLTPTLSPALGSPAINAGGADGCTPTDQRGDPRPVGSACDQGSVEASFRIKRKLKLKYDAGKGAFTGKVKASVNKCAKGKVTIFLAQSGDDEKVAKAKAKKGKFKLEEPNPDSGKYYAQVNEKQANEITCLAAKSKKQKV